jgi:hypothetical protein
MAKFPLVKQRFSVPSSGEGQEQLHKGTSMRKGLDKEGK